MPKLSDYPFDPAHEWDTEHFFGVAKCRAFRDETMRRNIFVCLCQALGETIEDAPARPADPPKREPPKPGWRPITPPGTFATGEPEPDPVDADDAYMSGFEDGGTYR